MCQPLTSLDYASGTRETGSHISRHINSVSSETFQLARGALRLQTSSLIAAFYDVNLFLSALLTMKHEPKCSSGLQRIDIREVA
jgi:hypothetical protein